MPAEPYAYKRGDTVENGKGNESRHDHGYRKQDEAGKSTDGEEERPLPRQGIAPVSELYERGDDRDRIPAENEIDKDNPDQEANGKDRENNSVVKEEDHSSDAKAETDVDELTDDLPHYTSVGMFRNNNPSARYRQETAQPGPEQGFRSELQQHRRCPVPVTIPVSGALTEGYR